MSYRTNPETVLDLVTENEAHKDLYINDEVFDLEIEHLFRNTWVYVGHGSQVPNKGDYYHYDSKPAADNGQAQR